MKRRKLWVSHNDNKYPLSVGSLVETLQGAGVATDSAIEFARQVEKHFQAEGSKTIKLAKLLEHTSKLLSKDYSQELVERFELQTPPFVPITVQIGETQEAFSRRLLASSLEKLPLGFKEANRLASHLEQDLRTKGYEQVSERELIHLIAVNLEASYGRELRLRYEGQLSEPISMQVVKGEDSSPFSVGILASSLMAVGLEPGEAHSFAKQCEDVLWHKNNFRLSRQALRDEVSQLLEAEFGTTFARRYELMKDLRNAEKPLIILIGGAPGVGKSTLAYELAYRLGIQRIVSSDAVREALRSLISKPLSPSLHLSSFTAWQAFVLPDELMKAKPKRVVRGFQSQVQQLGNALMGIIGRSITEAKSVILEGVYLVPGMLPLDDIGDATVIEIVLSVESEGKHRSHFVNREKETGQKRAQAHYLEHFEEIRILQDFILARAESEEAAVIEAQATDEMVNQALDLVMNAVLTETQEGLKGALDSSAIENTEDILV